MVSVPAQATMDCQFVIQAAGALRLKEFDFFRLAYLRWWGREAQEKTLERTFADYMFHEVVPPWVRHLSREVIRCIESDTLNPVSLGATLYRHRESPPRLLRLHVAAAGALLLALFLLIFAAPSEQAGREGAGCLGVPVSESMEKWVYDIAGQRPPSCDAFKYLK